MFYFIKVKKLLFLIKNIIYLTFSTNAQKTLVNKTFIFIVVLLSHNFLHHISTLYIIVCAYGLKEREQTYEVREKII